MDDRRHQISKPSLVASLLIVTLGVILLLDRMEMIEAGRIFRHWPLLLVLAGASRLLQRGCQGGARTCGGILLLAGVLLELSTIGALHLHWDTIWPLFIIVAGLSLLFHAFYDRRPAEDGARPLTRVNHWVVFGGGKFQSNAADFTGGDLFSLFGGYEIDLRDAGIQQQEAVLNVTAIFGGAEIRVPPRWDVVASVMPLFGGVDDKTSHPKPEAGREPPRLFIKGTTVFGGIEIKN